MKETEDTINQISQRAKARRIELGLTQRDVARLAGCHYVFVHDFEKGKTTLQIDKVIDVLTVLGLSVKVS